MNKGSKKKPPSRVRYEQNHPIVSCRIPRELYDRLLMINEKEGRSFTDILKVGLGVLEVKVASEVDVRKKGIEEGYERGYSDAKAKYAVYYPCNVCGGILAVSSVEERQAIKSCMKQLGWGHGSCHEKK